MNVRRGAWTQSVYESFGMKHWGVPALPGSRVFAKDAQHFIFTIREASEASDMSF